MLIPKLEITNPQAIEFINRFKSGELFHPLIAWFKRNRWYFFTLAIITVLIIAILLGKKIFQSSQIPVYSPSDIESITPTQGTTIKSDFSGLKTEIQDLSTDLPDPFIPVFDNNIDLEEPAI
ncbi:MAG TPA: hypothetical protein PLI45_02050 [Candidatus Woesebacteria bacterium]|nr:hypothetical protein [Candidatus Woesebacteria bacterium]